MNPLPLDTSPCDGHSELVTPTLHRFYLMKRCPSSVYSITHVWLYPNFTLWWLEANTTPRQWAAQTCCCLSSLAWYATTAPPFLVPYEIYWHGDWWDCLEVHWKAWTSINDLHSICLSKLAYMFGTCPVHAMHRETSPARTFDEPPKPPVSRPGAMRVKPDSKEWQVVAFSGAVPFCHSG